MARWLRFAWRQMNVQLQTRVLSWYTLALLLVQPAVFSGVGFALAHIAGRETPDLIYTIVGGGVMGLWSGMLFTSFFDVTRDRYEGTLELIVGSPTSLSTVLALRVLANIFTGSISLLGSFVIAALGFRLALPDTSFPVLILSLAIMLFAFWCAGVFLANFHAWSRVSGSFINYIEMPVAVIGGFMFPASVLPLWLLPLSTVLPLRWAVAALNAALAGSSDMDLAPDWLLALGLSALYLIAAYWLSIRVHDKIRVTGELSSI